MASELQRVAQSLVECLDQVPQVVAHLQRLAQKCRDNAMYIADFHSTQPAARTATLMLDEAARRCDEAADLAARTPLAARAWAAQMTGGTYTGPVTTSGISISAGRAPSNPQDLIRQKLPARKGIYDKTHGFWLDSQGREHELVSGHDDYRTMAEQLRVERRFRPTTATSHVEIKFAMLMRERGLRDETIYINNRPCEGPESCTMYLPDFLPSGARLTVHWPGGEPCRYEGRGQI